MLRRAVLVLNDEYGQRHPGALDEEVYGANQIVALGLLYRQVAEWLELPLLPYSDFRPQSYIRSRVVSYKGEVAPRAQHIDWERLQPTLPSASLCGSLILEKMAGGPLLHFLQHPQEYILPEDECSSCP
jgi:hypothetical protein